LGYERCGLVHFPAKGIDLAARDFHMFDPTKEALIGRFLFDDEVFGKVQNWLKTQPKNYFLTELKNLVKPWNRCVEVEGDYTEK
jgi:hypothetical protein